MASLVRRLRVPVTLAMGIWIALTAAALGQEFRGEIEGRVVDESGAALPGANVAATHIATGVGSLAVTNAQGLYRLPLLSPGIYRVSIELQGFRRVEREPVEVRVGDRVVLDVTLELGRLEEVITVSAETPLLEAGSGSAGQVIDEKRIELMPLSDGNPFVLTRLAAGITPVGDPRYFRPFDDGGTSDIAAAGGGTRDNAFTLDGSPNNGRRGTVAFVPPAGAVQEFKVQTATFDAQHGRSAGATVNVAMKSGTNTYKGDSYYFYRDEGMAANDFFLKRRGQPEPDLDYNRYGFVLGGPVQLGQLYSGKNRTFFFTAVEWFYNEFPDASQRSVPTLKQREGDFSELLSQGVFMYDPATAFQNAAGRIERRPFPNNIIPAARISPIAREVMKYYPLPNQPGDAQGRNNYLSGVTRNDDFYSVSIRVDHQLTNAQKMFGRYSYNDRLEKRSHWTGEVNGIVPTGFHKSQLNHSFNIDHVWTSSPSSILNVRGSWGQFYEFDLRPTQHTFDPASLGFSAQTAAHFGDYKYLPQFDLDRYDDLGGNYAAGSVNNHFAVQPTWTKLAGAHSFRVGYDLRVTREDGEQAGHPAGLYTFRSDFTRQLDNSPASAGQDLASLLLGLPTGGRIERIVDRFNQVVYHGAFVQDDWKVSDRLTLNLGLRYEYEGAPTERFNRNVRGFDPDAQLAITTAAEAAYARSPISEVDPRQFRVRGGVRFLDENNRSFWNADPNNIQPRIGFAYRWSPRTVLRGGWAIYAVPAVVEGIRQLGYTRSTNIAPTIDRGLTFRATLANPWPDGVLEPEEARLGPNTQVGQDIARLYNDLDFKNGQAMRWVVSLQRELPGRWVAEASYVGNRGYDLETDVELNGIPTEFLSRSPLRDDVVNGYLTAAVPNPLQGLAPGTGLNGATVQRQQLLRPFPQFTASTGGVQGHAYDGSSRYSSAQFRLDKRFSQGYSFLTTYTYSRSMERRSRLNAADTDYEERLSGNDAPHRVVVNPIWELPFGRERAIGRNANRLVDGLIGGWSVAAIWQWQSGRPLTLGNEYFDGDLSKLKTNVSPDTVDRVFDTSGFYLHDDLVQTGGVDDPAKQRADRRIQLASNLRTLPSRAKDFRGMPLVFWDVSVVKRVKTAGRVRAQIHFELYNANNYVWFRNPNVDPQNADFGAVTSQGNLPRNVQIGAKIAF